MNRILLLIFLCYFEIFPSQDYLYLFQNSYDGEDLHVCAGERCVISTFIGGKVQTFPAHSVDFFNPNYMPCGLDFEIIRITELYGRESKDRRGERRGKDKQEKIEARNGIDARVGVDGAAIRNDGIDHKGVREVRDLKEGVDERDWRFGRYGKDRRDVMDSIDEIFIKDHVIESYGANFLEHEPLFYTQPTQFNHTYCDLQLKPYTTTSTGAPYDPVTNIYQREYYPTLTCEPISSILSSSQLYLTNGTSLDTTLGQISVDISLFTSAGNLLNAAKNASQYVEPGDVRINFTLSRWNWKGYNSCPDSVDKAEYLEIVFNVAGLKIAKRVKDISNYAYGRNRVYDFESGTAVMSEIGIKDDKIIHSIPFHPRDSPINKNYFRIIIPRFLDYYSYEGIILRQNLDTECGKSNIISGC